MKPKSRWAISIGILSVLAAAPASAADYYCDGKIKSVGINGGVGALWVHYGETWQSICSVAAATNNQQPETCRGWLALLLAAHAQGKTVRFYYESTTPGNAASCSQLQSWSIYKPHFIHTLD